MWQVLYKLREQRPNYPFFNCALRKLKQLKKKVKGKREQNELEGSGENLCIKLSELFFKIRFAK